MPNYPPMETAFASTKTGRGEPDMFRTISLTALWTGTLHVIAANIHFYFNTDRGADLHLTGTGESLSIISYLSQGGPDHLFKYIAGAIFEEQANPGGTLMVIWGAVLHYMIVFLFTVFLFIIYPKVISWLKKKYIVSFSYGLFIWSVMNLVVLPLSKINRFPSDPTDAVITGLLLTIIIGLPVSLTAHRFYARKKSTSAFS